MDFSQIPPDPNRVHDVLIVGGGPSGSACAYWLADAGWDVALIEKKHFPRAKTCGDGLTPRSVRQLQDMGLEGALAGSHRYDGLRSCGYGRQIEMPWPSHPRFPSYGYVVTRHDLDLIVAEHAVKAGATVWQGMEAVAPLDPVAATSDRSTSSGRAASRSGSGSHELVNGSLNGAAGAVVVDRDRGVTTEIKARYVVVADGANSRFGRAMGTQRRRDWPMGMALRGYYASDRHDDTFIESHLDIRDASNQVVPGYGWVFPLGDGRVNVGVGLLSAEGRWKGVNTSSLMDLFIDQAPEYWGLRPEKALGPATGGRLPMGLAVGPRVGPNTLTIGDAAGTTNPFNGEGIAYGYESGRLAAASIGEALSGGGAEALVGYEERLQAAYGLYYQVARDFIALISKPRAMEICIRTGMRSAPLMKLLLRIMANLMRPDELGIAESTYLALAKVAQLVG